MQLTGRVREASGVTCPVHVHVDSVVGGEIDHTELRILLLNEIESRENAVGTQCALRDHRERLENRSIAAEKGGVDK